ncbi:MAG TPA: outer membrane beta-barrel protein [Acidiferrobacterales bacterium]|nr:outer membrane beta-barrel protein [Acidiferrobacterales bacterium]
MKSKNLYVISLCAAMLVAPLAGQAADWNGLYGGLHVGSSSDSTRLDVIGPSAGSSASFDLNGGVYGAQIGYNESISSDFMAGFEALYSLSDADAGTTTCPGTLTSCGAAVDWVTTLRARFGWTGSNIYLYGTVGIAYAQVKLSSNIGVDRKNSQGWHFGIGAETFLNKVISVSLEATKTNFNSNDFAIGGGNTAQADLSPVVLQAALNFRFR